MSVRDLNEAFIMKFLEDGTGGEPIDAPFRFNGEEVDGIDAVLNLLGDEYKVNAMDRKTIRNNVHAVRVRSEPAIKVSKDKVSKD